MSAASGARSSTASVCLSVGPVSRAVLALVPMVAGLALLVGCLVFVDVAHATKFVHGVVAEGQGVGAGQLKPSFSADVAVNRSAVVDGSFDPLGGSTDGYVYLVDEDNHRVQVFSADGEFQFMWGGGVLDGGAVGQVCDRTDASCTGEVLGSLGGMFIRPQGIAIDQDTGHVFVQDRAATATTNTPSSGGRIQEFEADGTFVRAWGWDVVQGGVVGFETCFDAALCKGAVVAAGPTSPGQFASGSNNVRLAVQQSTGDVLASDPGTGNRRVQRFSVPANPADPIPVPTVFGSATQFATGHPHHLAVDENGIVYASTGSTGSNSIVRYDLSSATFLTPIPVAALTGSSTSATTAGLEIDPVSGNLFVARDQFLAAGQRFSPVYELGNPGTPTAANVTLVDTHVAGTNFSWGGLGLDPESDTLYVGGRAADSTPMLLAAKDGPAPAPEATFMPYAAGAHDATIDFSIDTNGILPVSYTLQFANANAPADFKTVATGQVTGSDDPVAVSKAVSGLRAGSVYLVRVLLSKPFNNPTATIDSAAPLLTDPATPALTDVRADAISPTGARLAGRVNPEGSATSYQFEWGVGSFSSAVPIPAAAIGNGFAYGFVSEQLADLAPETTYQFRLAATNEHGTATSSTHTFTTPAETTEGRVFELVSPADKYGGQGVGFWPRGLGHMMSSGIAAHEGERFAASSMYGATLDGNGGFSHSTDFAFADRIDSVRGWRSRSPISHPNYAPGLAQPIEIQGGSHDLSKVFWGSTSTLALFPELAGGGDAGADRPGWGDFDAGLLSDWRGPLADPTRWELFGPTDLDSQVVDSSELGSSKQLWTMALARSGSDAFAMTRSATTKLPLVHGLAGADDPTAPSYGDLVSGRSIYHADLSGPLADSFAGTGERDLVNVCTDGPVAARTTVPAVVADGELEAAVCPAGVGGRAALISNRGAAFTLPGAVRDGAVSDDGSRVFFLSPDPLATGVPNGTTAGCSGTGAETVCPPQLFVRQRNGDGELVTRWVSKPQVADQMASLTGSVRFEGASKSGDIVYFRTNSPLTADDPNGAGAPVSGGVKTGTPDSQSWDLYRFELADGPDPTGPGSSLTRVSAGPDGTGDCNSPLPELSAPGLGNLDADSAAALRFLSEDGDRAYFACQAALPGVPAASNGTITSPGGSPTSTDETNLYLYDGTLPPAARWRFVARLPRAGSGTASHAVCASVGAERRSPFGAASDVNPEISDNSARANCVRGTADGKFITLFTPGRLTADDPGGALVDDPPGLPVADIYGYDADSDELARITAPQGGEETAYPCVGDIAITSDVDESTLFACRGDGGVDTQIGVSYVGTVPANLGIAVDPLVAGDRVAFFHSASRLVAEDLDDGYDVYQWRNGELSLVTSGAPDSEDALYKGNDRTGRNLYLVTRDALSWQDVDVVADIYTARVDGGIPQPDPTVICEVLAGGCHGPGADDLAAPGAETMAPSGVGNDLPGVRRRVAIEAITAQARRAAARSGVVKVRVRSSAAGRVVVTVDGRVGRRVRRVGSASKALAGPGTATVGVRLSRAARRQLRSGRRLGLSIRVRSGQARPRAVRVVLRRAGK